MPKYRQPLASTHEDGKKYGTGYGSGCLGKVKWIFEHTGILLTYQEVSALCKFWADESGHPDTWTYEDTWNKLRELDEVGKLREEIQRFRKKKRATILMNYAQQEGIQIETSFQT